MSYLNVVEVESALAALASAHPTLCELITLPNATHEGRTSHALRIGRGPLGGRPAMLFIGGQHAREWGSSEICINLATDLLDAYSTNAGLVYGGKTYTAAQVRSIVDDSHIFLFACVNPDGRHHSQTSVPMWRKNRNPGGAVDINRNYDFLWNFETALSSGAGAVISSNPASDTYRGTAPFSEPETRNVKWLLDSYPSIRWMIDIHSYSRLLYHNWGDDQSQITDPTMNFRNPAFDGMRGHSGDAYREYIRPGDRAAEQCLVSAMRDALQAVRGETYATGESFALYPTTATATDYPYSRHYADPGLSKVLGFLIEWGNEFQPPWAEMELIIADVSSALIAFALAAPCACSTIDVQLLTPTVAFNAVIAGEQTFRAAVFRVASCRAADFDVVDGPRRVSGPVATTFGTPLGSSASSPGSPSGTTEARIWISFRGTAPGDHATGTVTVRCRQSGEEWVIPITADTISRPATAAVLVLDQSNSMTFPSGIGGTDRATVLRFSAPPLIEVIDEMNGLGIVAFDHDAYTRQVVRPMDLPGRLGAQGVISSYAPNPNGWTSIGEALLRARELLVPATGYASRSIIVLTDGAENHGGHTRRTIAQAASAIDSRVFAIGLGTAENLQPGALQALCNGTQGYMMMTGPLDSGATFRLAKYYQQILANVTNQNIIVDPEGTILPEQVHRIPFHVSEADITSDVIVLTPFPDALTLRLETPDGELLEPAAGSPALDLRSGANVLFCHIALPVPLGHGAAHAGRWHALLNVEPGKIHEREPFTHHSHALASLQAHGVPYSLLARTWSDIDLRASLSQDSNEPGAGIRLRAALTEYDAPLAGSARVGVELERPDGTSETFAMDEAAPGVFEAGRTADLAGVYRFRVLARGTSQGGYEFTREQTMTAAVWRGGDSPPAEEPGHHWSRGCCCWLWRWFAVRWMRRAAKRAGLTDVIR